MTGGAAFIRSSRSLHVMMTADAVGGVWDFSCSLSRELVARGHRVTLLVFGEPSPWQRMQAQEAQVTVRAESLKLEWMQDSVEDVRRAQHLTAELVQDLGPDLLHANQYALACLGSVIPTVLTAHSDVLTWKQWVEGAASVREAQHGEWAAYAALVRQALASAQEAVAVSAFQADQMRLLYQPNRAIRVIHNGWDDSEPPPEWESRRGTVIAGRAWDRAKNLALVARAAQGWDSGPVVLAGEQVHPEGGRAVVDPPIRPLGFVPRNTLRQLLTTARVYVSPALYDPFGLLPLQAAMAGCPLVLSDVPSYRELWDDAALFFDPHDPSSLRGAWACMLADTPLAQRLAVEAAHRARSRYTATRMASDYVELYRHVLAGAATDPVQEATPA